MAAAIEHAKFDELLAAEGKTIHNPCRRVPGIGAFLA